MFSLYGISGQNFRGTLEQLSALPGVASARRARGIARDGEEPYPSLVEHFEGQGGAHPGHDDAVRSYLDTQQLDQPRDALCHAYQIMTREVFTLTADLPAASAWRALLGRGVRQAPVLADGRDVIGLVSERDLLTTFNLERKQSRSPIAHHVGDVMVSPVICVDPDTDIRRVAQAMLKFDLPSVPVVNESRQLLGLVSRGDILRAVIAEPPLSLWV
jgi:acetoin utilization protein AcuB